MPNYAPLLSHPSRMALQSVWLGLSSSSLNVDHYPVISSIWHQEIPSSAKEGTPETIFSAHRYLAALKIKANWEIRKLRLCRIATSMSLFHLFPQKTFVSRAIDESIQFPLYAQCSRLVLGLGYIPVIMIPGHWATEKPKCFISSWDRELERLGMSISKNKLR